MQDFTIFGRTIRAVDARGNVPIDPELPDEKHHDLLTKEEVATWWDVPFVQTMPAGTFCVRVYDGGAWDRSSGRGIYDTLDEAVQAAENLLRERGPSPRPPM